MSIVPPWALHHRNNQGMTPGEIFNQEHKELVPQGEKWMKDTAKSYTVVGALIVTITFAAASTVPGGNLDSGFPIFLKQKLFMIFMISDSLSLFSSTTFLGILTSSYLQEDFLVSLPRRLMIGLFALFFSIVSMMVAFSATLLIVFGDNYPWISIPVTCLASIPVTLFVFLQFPLLADIFSSTCGRGMFDKKVRI
nr:ankyrin repeat-containing protein NPR4-like [Ziziphus jujuba var. spinosa]